MFVILLNYLLPNNDYNGISLKKEFFAAVCFLIKSCYNCRKQNTFSFINCKVNPGENSFQILPASLCNKILEYGCKIDTSQVHLVSLPSTLIMEMSGKTINNLDDVFQIDLSNSNICFPQRCTKYELKNIFVLMKNNVFI